ncbi:MAG: MBOAT family protein, partial [Bacteroidales bacterium]
MEYIKEILLYSEDKPMLFTRLYFWVFFAILLAFYSIIYKKNPLRNAYLFLMSLFFYYQSSGYFFMLLIFSTISDYILGWLIYKAEEKIHKKIFVTISVAINLGLLSYFKYAYFFSDIINRVFNTNIEVVDFLAQWSNSIA